MVSGAAETPKVVANLVFEPGFTTTSTVSKISGRGVGMDSIKSYIEKSDGRITVEFTKPKPSINAFEPVEFVMEIDAEQIAQIRHG